MFFVFSDPTFEQHHAVTHLRGSLWTHGIVDPALGWKQAAF